MNPLLWSIVLQWSRFGINAVVFLLAARVLTLREFGTFATAFALIKLAQGFHKSGVVETVVIKMPTANRLHALFGISLFFGALLSSSYLLVALKFGVTNPLLPLATIPTLLGISAVSDGILRKHLNIRALALRTTASQSLAATIALIALLNGFGIAALVVFAVLNTALSALISIILAAWFPTALPSLKNMRLTLGTVLRIAGRDVLNSGVLPITQLAIGVFIGLPAAGAFQIATRVLSMLDALTLAPLRYIALPKLAAINAGAAYNSEITKSLYLSAVFGCWVWFGLASSTTKILGLIVGAEHAVTVEPILLALIPIGVGAALSMTFTQALLGKGETRLVLSRALWTFLLSSILTIPMFLHSTLHVAVAVSLANLVVLAWFLKHASAKLSLGLDNLIPICPAIFSGFTMMLVVILSELPLAGRIALGTLTYISILKALQLRTRRNISI